METPPPSPSSAIGAQARQKMSALEAWMAPIFVKFPHLPLNVRELLVTIAPWLALLFGILGIVGLLSAFSVLSVVSSIAPVAPAMTIMYPMMFVSLIVGAISAVLNLLAFKPLLNKQKKGWTFIFYGSVLSAAYSIINIGMGYSGIGSLIGALIGFWLLFEIREMYKS